MRPPELAPFTPLADAKRRSLRRELGLLEVTTLTAGSMIGSGIFIVPAFVASAFPDPWTMAALWAAGGLVALAGALAFAELATMFPVSGGPYVFAREAFGPLPGFLAGWSMLLGKVFVGPAVALIFARYLAFLFPVSPRGVVLLAAWAIVAVTFVNYLGVRFGGAVQNLFTILKLGALASVVALAALFADPAARIEEAPPIAGGVSLALLGIMFAYNSWFNATFVAEEVRDPARNLPRGLALGVLVVTAAYVAASVAYWALLGSRAMAASPLVGAEAASEAVAWGGAFVAWGVLVSTFGNLNGGVLVTARMGLAMARDGFLPRAFAFITRHGTPGGGLVLFSAISLGLLLVSGFEALITYGTFVTWLFLSVAIASVYRLRRTRPDAPRPYRAWGYPATPLVFLAGTLLVLGITAWENVGAVAGGLAAVAVGVPLWWWGTRARRAPAS